MNEALPAPPEFLIESEQRGVRLNLGELWRFRELLYFLTLRDIKVRYKQTLLGITWVLIQPLLTMLIFTLVFNRFVRVNTAPVPYPLFALSGLMLWLFFSNAVTNSAASLVLNAQLITKVYFPRMYIPAATVGTGLVDSGISLLLLIVVAVYYGTSFSLTALLLPVFILMMALFALGVGLVFASLTVKYRDLRHALPFVIQLWMFASPIVYPASVVPQKWRWLLLINPVAGIVEGFRAALTGTPLDWPHILISFAIIMIVLIVALYVFRRAEDGFVEVI
ncbi:MAG TPA: ABC transporter permease [Pyrinomonadaceae bacterium]|nr:ABC transporter permease [Pyrinomonadaceae bacterium]